MSVTPADAAPDAPPEDGDRRARLPGRAALVGLAGIVLGYYPLGYYGAWLGDHISTTERVWALLLSQFGLWAGLVGAAVVASRRWGTGRLGIDFAICPRLRDVGWGVLYAVADVVASLVVMQIVVEVLGKRYQGGNSEVVTDYTHDLPALAVVVAFAVVGAPIIEELFFRGLMMRSLQSWIGVTGGVLLQGLLFGAIHVSEVTGAGALGLWLALSAVGVVHGIAYHRVKRLTAAMWTHAFFNAGQVATIFALLTLR